MLGSVDNTTGDEMTTAHTADDLAAMPYFYKKRADGSLIVGSQLLQGSPHFQCDTDIPEPDLRHMVNSGNAHYGLVKALEEAQHFLRFHHTSEDAHMVRIAAALAKAGA